MADCKGRQERQDTIGTIKRIPKKDQKRLER